MDYNHHDNRAISLYDTLKNSYKPLREQDAFYKQHGYELDRQLSNRYQQVLFNPRENKLLYTIAGSRTPFDWIVNNPAIALGQFKHTQRYIQSKQALDKAKEKYHPQNTTIAGHSQAGYTAGLIANKKDKVLTLDRATGPNNKIRGNEQAFRVEGDIVSLLGKPSQQVKSLPNHNFLKDPLRSHDIEQIKDLDVFV
jgi:hypothetical protein